MAGAGEEEPEYESDPEEVKMSLKMRRREASDDEDSDVAEEMAREKEREVSHPRAGMVDFDVESDDQGAAAEYDDEEEDGEEYYDEQEEYEEEVVEGQYEEEREIEGGGNGVGGEVKGGGEAKAVDGGDVGHELMGQTQGEGQGQDEKKQNEPSAVPTSGAFYMHDDRFRDNAGGRHRRTFGGRKLWESKDEKKWGHDKFEEMNMQNRHYEEGRRPFKGYYRGRGRGRGADRGYTRGNRRGYGGNNYQNAEPKDVRGRGPKRYHPSMKSKSETLPSQNKRSAKSTDKTSHAGTSKIPASIPNQNVEHESVPAKKVSSSLSSASPPFYPSGSSNKDVTTPKKDVQVGNHNRNSRSSVMDPNFSMPLSNTMLRGKNVIDSVVLDKLHIDESVSSTGAKPLNNVHLPSATSSLSADQMAQLRSQGKGVAISGSTMFQPPQSNNQVSKVSPPTVQASVLNRGQASLQASSQQLGQRSLSASQGSPPKPGKGTTQVAGRGTVVYGGAQVVGSGGNMGAGHGEQNLPAFFPVMQFGAQHPGGIGVPAVGMAFPGYVAQPNGRGNPEMTWLPVITSATGALGANYCPPYLAVDGTYHSQPTGQTSALPAPSKDNNLGKLNNEVKPQQRSEVSNDEFSQRQNKPRRYSEMNFSQ